MWIEVWVSLSGVWANWWWGYNPASIQPLNLQKATLRQMHTAISKVQREEEVAAVARLAEEIWREHFTPIIGAEQVVYMLDKFQSAKAISSQLDSGTEYYMASVDELPVGYTALIPDESSSKLMISKLYVRRDRRGSGIGGDLLKFIESECEKRKFTYLWLTVNRFNDGPIQWYCRQGFYKVDEVKKDIGGGFYMDDYIMEKNLQAESAPAKS